MDEVRTLKNENIRRRKLRRKDIDDNVLIRLYLTEKMSVYSIAKLLGFEYMTIRSRLIRAGVYKSGGHKVTLEVTEVNEPVTINDIKDVIIYTNGIVINKNEGDRKLFKVINNKLYVISDKGDKNEQKQENKIE